MLFNSYGFILLFLPVTFLLYFGLIRARKTTGAKLALVACSLFFYGYWNPRYLALMLFSIGFNFLCGLRIARADTPRARKGHLALGVAVNLLLIGYYKYTNFFLANVNALFGTSLPHLDIVLPLAISFFTFQQIAYLVDSYSGTVREHDIVNYTLFITFFPQLIAGPIVHHRAMIPQFSSRKALILNYRNIAAGLFLFGIGLSKKVLLADNLATWVGQGFGAASIQFHEAWITSLSYTLQLYFDFSGYMDMAMGSALLLNIRVPINFRSPYKATSVQEFWRRWHITLGDFLRDYLYIPLGGNRKGAARTYLNLAVTFLLCGLWHGAAWTFVFWGGLHGAALVLNRAWSRLGPAVNKGLALFLTFNFVNIGWVFFRAKDFSEALKVLRAMFTPHAIPVPALFADRLPDVAFRAGQFFGALTPSYKNFVILCGGLVVVLLLPNSHYRLERFKPDARHMLATAAMFTVCLFSLNNVTEFIYFNF
ncbi:MAG: MBOAT family protein [Desulfovibrionaceae bacterium]|jgi:D-alanyl-lipoteichoic acid acyltransferase DltB (MBOAT superfamily)|nr:MBOAT family protein [Desulfovibrionaceae bacterium]